MTRLRDYVVDSDYADGMLVFVDDGQGAQIVFVEKLEDFFVIGIGFETQERLHFQLGHALLGRGEEQTRYGDGAGELRGVVEQNYGVELLEIQVLVAEP